MAAQTAPSPYTSPSSSLNGRTWKYDVFLSFRGEDTRNTFTDHLYHALLQRRVIVYRDNELKRGDNISQVVYKALEQSRISIVILSSNYANSKWCLDELSKIVECMNGMRQRVLPVFYDVEPSEVRKQTGTFGNAFAEHEQVFRDNREKVLRWRDALYQVANLSGFVIRNRYESEVISQILKMVLNALPQVFSHGFLVGIDSRVDEIHVLLDLESNDVRFIGIWGMGGIGKTTIAEVIFQKISAEFEIFTYVPNIREATNEQGGLLQLQKNLLSEALMQINLDVLSVAEGARMIRNSLSNRKVLLFLDDVDHLDQLESLAGNQNWFGLGSRIIITTRDQHLLVTHGVEKSYELEGLNEVDALQLFSWNAFKKDHPEEDYLELSKCFMEYAGGLPLALTTLGSFLYKRSRDAWTSALDKLKKAPNRTIFGTLKMSYDGLDEIEKRIFLDVACFLKGYNKERTIEVLDSYGFCPRITVDVLAEKSLLTISDNHVCMHDLIQEMGREIVRQESYEEPGRRSRLWHRDDILNVFTKNRGTKTIEGIVLHLPELEEAHWNPEAFSKMSKLRLLQIHNLSLSQGPKYLSNALKFLDWSWYPSKFLPPTFQPDAISELNLRHSKINCLWNGSKVMFLNICHCTVFFLFCFAKEL